MNLIARAVRFLFWFVVVWCGTRLLRLILSADNESRPFKQAGDSSGTDAGASALGQKLVRDPICGTHVAERLALPLQNGAETLHFCSVACRDRYAAQTRKLAANG
jgi:YHS domain-containing protein